MPSQVTDTDCGVMKDAHAQSSRRMHRYRSIPIHTGAASAVSDRESPQLCIQW